MWLKSNRASAWLTKNTSYQRFCPHFRSTCLSNLYLCLQPLLHRRTSERPCREKGTKIGQRSMLSKVDCMKLNQKFGCFKEGDTWHNEKIRWARAGAGWTQTVRERSVPAYKLHVSLNRFRVICGMMGFSFWIAQETWWTYYFTHCEEQGARRRRRRREGTKIREEWIGTKMNRNERNGYKFHCDVWLARKIILEIRENVLLSACVCV